MPGRIPYKTRWPTRPSTPSATTCPRTPTWSRRPWTSWRTSSPTWRGRRTSQRRGWRTWWWRDWVWSCPCSTSTHGPRPGVSLSSSASRELSSVLSKSLSGQLGMSNLSTQLFLQILNWNIFPSPCKTEDCCDQERTNAEAARAAGGLRREKPRARMVAWSVITATPRSGQVQPQHLGQPQHLPWYIDPSTQAVPTIFVSEEETDPIKYWAIFHYYFLPEEDKYFYRNTNCMINQIFSNYHFINKWLDCHKEVDIPSINVLIMETIFFTKKLSKLKFWK